MTPEEYRLWLDRSRATADPLKYPQLFAPPSFPVMQQGLDLAEAVQNGPAQMAVPDPFHQPPQITNPMRPPGSGQFGNFGPPQPRDYAPEPGGFGDRQLPPGTQGFGDRKPGEYQDPPEPAYGTPAEPGGLPDFDPGVPSYPELERKKQQDANDLANIEAMKRGDPGVLRTPPAQRPGAKQAALIAHATAEAVRSEEAARANQILAEATARQQFVHGDGSLGMGGAQQDRNRMMADRAIGGGGGIPADRGDVWGPGGRRYPTSPSATVARLERLVAENPPMTLQERQQAFRDRHGADRQFGESTITYGKGQHRTGNQKTDIALRGPLSEMGVMQSERDPELAKEARNKVYANQASNTITMREKIKLKHERDRMANAEKWSGSADPALAARGQALLDRVTNGPADELQTFIKKINKMNLPPAVTLKLIDQQQDLISRREEMRQKAEYAFDIKKGEGTIPKDTPNPFAKTAPAGATSGLPKDSGPKGDQKPVALAKEEKKKPRSTRDAFGDLYDELDAAKKKKDQDETKAIFGGELGGSGDALLTGF